MENLNEILKNYQADARLLESEEQLNGIRLKYLGKSGVLTDALKHIKNLPNDQKKEYGERVNTIKSKIEEDLATLKQTLEIKEITAAIEKAKFLDLTVPLSENVGSLHPVTIVTKKIINAFVSMGFSVEDGNEIETEYNNFEAVNVPKNHPARDMQDTFYLHNGQLLKTHTSASQNRIMKKYGPPLKVIFPGRCFRNEELDASHENTFFQLEGMMIDKDISISHLIFFMKNMLSEIFEKEIDVRLRPGFFPFVEPGFELDARCPYCDGVGCSVCKQTGWIELCPCGMIHPSVLKMGGIDPEKYQGFAFGLGLTRMAMMTFEIGDIRMLNSGKLNILKQAKIK